ncbi:unnamed protein product, partial [Ectocarpus sp. 12 AP-2014]
ANSPRLRCSRGRVLLPENGGRAASAFSVRAPDTAELRAPHVCTTEHAPAARCACMWCGAPAVLQGIRRRDGRPFILDCFPSAWGQVASAWTHARRGASFADSNTSTSTRKSSRRQRRRYRRRRGFGERRAGSSAGEIGREFLEG